MICENRNASGPAQLEIAALYGGTDGGRVKKVSVPSGIARFPSSPQPLLCLALSCLTAESFRPLVSKEFSSHCTFSKRFEITRKTFPRSAQASKPTWQMRPTR